MSAWKGLLIGFTVCLCPPLFFIVMPLCLIGEKHNRLHADQGKDFEIELEL